MEDTPQQEALMMPWLVLSQQIQALERSQDRRFEDLGKRIDELKEDTNKRFEQVDKRFEAVDKRFESVDKRFTQVDAKFEKMDEKIERVFNRTNLWGIVSTALLAIIGVIIALHL